MTLTLLYFHCAVLQCHKLGEKENHSTEPVEHCGFTYHDCEDFCVYECTKIFQQMLKHHEISWTKNKIHLILIGKELVATSK